MLTRRDVELIAAASRSGGSRDVQPPRRGCLPGCTMPLVMFVLCGLPFDLLILGRLIGIIK